MFQQPQTFTFESIIVFHDSLMMVGVFIALWVMYFIVVCTCVFSMDTPLDEQVTKLVEVSHNSILESVWTIVPTVLLCNIMASSFALLYVLEEVYSPGLTVKIVGQQWY